MRLINFFLSRVWADLYGKGLTSLLERLLRVCWFSVQVCPTYPAIVLGCCLGKSCCARMMSWPCFRRLYLTSFIFVHAQLWPTQVRAPVKGSGVIYPQAFTQPLAILGNTWMEGRSLESCLSNQLPKQSFGKALFNAAKCEATSQHLFCLLCSHQTTRIFQVISAQCAHKTMTMFILILEFLTSWHFLLC